MSVEKLDSRPELCPVTFDQMFYSAELIELEAIHHCLRELLRLTKAEAKP